MHTTSRLARTAAILDARHARRGLRPPLPAGYALAEIAGHRLRYRTAGDGERLVILCTDPPVVLEQYDELLALLAPHHRVVVFEAPGFGFSAPAVDMDFSFAALNGAVEAFVEQLVDREGRGPATLAFPCVTAYAAVDVARRRPDLVASLLLMQAPSWAAELGWKRGRDKRGLLGTPGLGQVAMATLRRRRAPQWLDVAVGRRERLPAMTAAVDAAFAAGAPPSRRSSSSIARCGRCRCARRCWPRSGKSSTARSRSAGPGATAIKRWARTAWAC